MQVLLPVFELDHLFVVVEFKSSLYLLGINPYQIYNLQIYFYSFTLLIVSFSSF
jgi:hypothetical protein